jgi:hypothetical protein
MCAGRGRPDELTGVAFMPAGWSSATPRRKGLGVVMMSERLVRSWEAVYREYGTASQRLRSAEAGDPTVARHMARASADVAAVWRDMAAESDLPWWSVAALCAAAQAFEYQSRDWSARAKYEITGSSPSRRPHQQITRPASPAHEIEVDRDGRGAWSQ